MPWSASKYGDEKSTACLRASVMVTCERARSASSLLPLGIWSKLTLITLMPPRPRRGASSVVVSYSKPLLSLAVLGGSLLSPFQHPSAGRLVATVSTPAFLGVNVGPGAVVGAAAAVVG